MLIIKCVYLSFSKEDNIIQLTRCFVHLLMTEWPDHGVPEMNVMHNLLNTFRTSDGLSPEAIKVIEDVDRQQGLDVVHCRYFIYN